MAEHQSAYFDPLTKLANGRLLADCLQKALLHSAKDHRDGALIFVAVDGFKPLSDSLGHNIGDLLPPQVAQRLTNCVRGYDTVACLEDCKFAVLLEDLSENLQQAIAQAEIIGKKILAEISRPYQLADHEYISSVSVGVAMFEGGKHKFDELMQQADNAMHQARQNGHNILVFFSSGIQKN